MKTIKKVFINAINKAGFFEAKIMSVNMLERLYRYIKVAFEEEAVECYISDKMDIGFFESFLLGSDKTKKISSETTHTLEVFKKAEMIKKLTGYITPNNKKKSDELELIKENIDSKKRLVVDMLQKKGEIIKYIGRRIVVRDEQLYIKLERLYDRLGNEIKKRNKV